MIIFLAKYRLIIEALRKVSKRPTNLVDHIKNFCILQKLRLLLNELFYQPFSTQSSEKSLKNVFTQILETLLIFMMKLCLFNLLNQLIDVCMFFVKDRKMQSTAQGFVYIQKNEQDQRTNFNYFRALFFHMYCWNLYKILQLLCLGEGTFFLLIEFHV